MKILLLLAMGCYLLTVVYSKNKFIQWPALIAGLSIHLGVCVYLLFDQAGWFFGLQDTLLLLSALSILTLMVAKIHIRVAHSALMGLAIMILLWLLIAPQQPSYIPLTWETVAHILFSLTAYSILFVSSVLAIGLWLQIRNLHQMKITGSSLSPISLLDNEEKLFRITAFGWIVLSCSILSGVFFVDDYLGQKIGHKVVFSFVAWGLFGLLLIGRTLRGWRGKTAIKIHLLAMLLLAVGYLGSKLVIEYIL